MRAGADELIRVQDRYYILASSQRVDDRTRVLKHGDTFAVLDRFGDMAPVGFGELGLYHDGTRFLSRLGLTFGHQRPLILSSTVTEDNVRLVVDLTNPDLHALDRVTVPRGTIHVRRETLLFDGVCYERLGVTHYGREPAEFSLHLRLEADFADIFEVRGMRRTESGRLLPAAREESGPLFAYQGRDGRLRRTRVGCSDPPRYESDDELRWDVRLEGHEHWLLSITIACEPDGARVEALGHERAAQRLEAALSEGRADECVIETSNAAFDDWCRRSLADLHMMITATPHGPYPYAGTPWFSAPFGRDGIVTALETLWVNPSIARGVLAFLAAHQADAADPARDAEPGKILHEMRGGEMAALGEVPFGRYYGSVDATPLFVLLAGAAYARTADLALAERMWPHVDRALQWIDGDGDPDRDGFVEYRRHSDRGLVQQGWKDSNDSVFHRNGTLLLEGRVALCEVQGYAYAARRAAATLAAAVGRERRAGELLREAESLRGRFEEAFWCEDLGTYALALDGAKRPCEVRASNAGHALFAGIAGAERALRVARTLMADDCFSGWGIRTLSSREQRYNPMAYHNGSVWPHDNALIAAGFARYGLRDEALRVFEALFEVGSSMDLFRMPELFCGFQRIPGSGPTLYPVACAPQAWAAAAVFLLLGTCLGIDIDAPAGRVSLRRPMLPPFLEEVRVRNLRVGNSSADLRFERHGRDVAVHVVRREGPLEVLIAV